LSVIVAELRRRRRVIYWYWKSHQRRRRYFSKLKIQLFWLHLCRTVLDIYNTAGVM